VRAGQTGGAEIQRFFLAKPGGSHGVLNSVRSSLEGGGNGGVTQTGLSYFVVSEWRGIADFSGKKPQLGREAVRNAPKAG